MLLLSCICVCVYYARSGFSSEKSTIQMNSTGKKHRNRIHMTKMENYATKHAHTVINLRILLLCFCDDFYFDVVLLLVLSQAFGDGMMATVS